MDAPLTPEEKMQAEVMNALRQIWFKLETIESFVRSIEQGFIAKEVIKQYEREQTENQTEQPNKENPQEVS